MLDKAWADYRRKSAMRKKDHALVAWKVTHI